MGRRTLSVALAASSLWAAGCSRAELSAEPKSAPAALRTVSISTGSQGGNFYPLGMALAKAYKAALPDINPAVTVTGGALTNLDLLQRGEADLAFSFANVSYAAFVGRLTDRPQPFAHLRALALLQLEPVQVVIGGRSTAKTVRDFEGHRVASNGAGSGASVTAHLLFEVYGVNEAAIKPAGRPYAELDAGLSDGSVDAVIVLARYPFEPVRRALEGGAHLMPLVGDPVERLHRDYPFIRSMVIPAGVYPGQASAVQTIGVNSLLLCRDDLDEELVYRLTKTLFQSIDEGRNELFRSIDLGNVAATPIPLHPGAARYYRERELFP